MSRSKRKTPKMGNAGTRASEKFDKRVGNRRFRRITEAGIHHGKENLPTHPREVIDKWAMRKDGKSRFDPKENPKFMRK